MMMNAKKIRFALLSTILVGMTYLLAFKLVDTGQVFSFLPILKVIGFISVTTILSAIFVQYLQGGERGIGVVSYVGIMPFLLILGCFLFYLYYPNLSIFLKLAAAIFYNLLLYTLLLLNNVLLVVESREVRIPVYRVAINWVQIVLLSISISVFTGLFRVQIQPLLQVLLIMAISFFCYKYLLWVYSNDNETRKINFPEGIILSGIFTLMAGWGAFTTLFFPAESFLRGIFVASIFLLGLGYLQLYLKNSLSKRNIWDYLFISLVFFGILIVFRP